MSRGLCPPAVTHLVITSRFGCCGCRWWLQQLGGQRHRRQLVGTLAIIGVVAAVLAEPPLGRTDATERRFCGLDCIDGHCSRRVVLPSVSGSCTRQAEAIGTLGGLIRT